MLSFYPFSGDWATVHTWPHATPTHLLSGITTTHSTNEPSGNYGLVSEPTKSWLHISGPPCNSIIRRLDMQDTEIPTTSQLFFLCGWSNFCFHANIPNIHRSSIAVSHEMFLPLSPKLDRCNHRQRLSKENGLTCAALEQVKLLKKILCLTLTFKAYTSSLTGDCWGKMKHCTLIISSQGSRPFIFSPSTLFVR